MHIDPVADESPVVGPGLSLATAASLQDDLLIVTNDLGRLQQLLGDTCRELLNRFEETRERLLPLLPSENSTADAPAVVTQVQAALDALGSAVLALQFEDMSNQLVTHTTRRLRNCADRLAREVMGDDEDGQTVVEQAPDRPNPVIQDEMDAGSVELF